MVNAKRFSRNEPMPMTFLSPFLGPIHSFSFGTHLKEMTTVMKKMRVLCFLPPTVLLAQKWSKKEAPRLVVPPSPQSQVEWIQSSEGGGAFQWDMSPQIPTSPIQFEVRFAPKHFLAHGFEKKHYLLRHI